MLPVVSNSAELERVLAIPRRHWTDENLSALAEWLTPYLVTESGRSAGVRLRPGQAWVLWEGHENSKQRRGVYARIPTSGGKTLICKLLPVVMNAKRAIMFVKASLKDQTERNHADIERHWICSRPPVRVETYNALTQAHNVNLLEEYRPDLIILDEAQKARRSGASVRRRISRYMHDNPDTMCCVLSATFVRKSLRDFAHLLLWSLKDQAPIPVTWVDLEEWCEALDLDNGTGRARLPGALIRLVDPTIDGNPAGQELAAIGRAFKRRLEDTPGVIMYDVSECDTPININVLRAPDDPILDHWFSVLREKEITPDGWPLVDPLSVTRVGGEMGEGFFYYWNPRPPQEWLRVRYAYNVWIRQTIADSQRTKRPLDTEGAVRRAYPEAPELLEWDAIEPTFKPNSVPWWLSASFLGFTIDRIKAAGKPSIVWTCHASFAETLSDMTGLAFYSTKGRDKNNRSILDAPKDRSLIASVASIGEGLCLPEWSYNIVAGVPSIQIQSALAWEQFMSRTHRTDQKHPVTFDVLLGCAEHEHAFSRALEEARFVKEKQGRQKLLEATIVWPPNTAVGKRWNRNK